MTAHLTVPGRTGSVLADRANRSGQSAYRKSTGLDTGFSMDGAFDAVQRKSLDSISLASHVVIPAFHFGVVHLVQ
jgi:hypothetical protein